jgi:hypothetical protein
MTDIVIFRAQAQLDAEKNVQRFIELCRNDLTVFGTDLPFDEHVWDITEFLDLRGLGNAHRRLVFSTLESVNDKSPTYMSEPFLSFAKSYMRYMHGLRPLVDAAKRLSALRALHEALSEKTAQPNPALADALTFNRAAQMLGEKYTNVVAYSVGCQLKLIATFLAENRLTAVPIQWRNFLKRPSDTVRVGKEFDERRQSKMPSESALNALPKAFCLATTPVDVVVTSVAALLCSAPDRICEVFSLPSDCEVYQKQKNREKAYGLRWWPAKGAEPMVKWLVPTLTEVAQEAIRKVREITKEARLIAQWYEDNPHSLYLPKGAEYLRDKEWLDTDDLAKILGFKILVTTKWLQGYNVQSKKIKNRIHVRFSEFERAVIARLPRKFPVLDAKTGLKYSEALFVVRVNELGTQHSTYHCMIEPISINQINSGLGARVVHGAQSVFSRLGFAEPDGKPIKITTHQFRHYLNTLAQAGGMSQLDIAKWSGRKDIRQNAAYDHVTPDQMLAKIRNAIGDESQMFGPLAKIPKKVLIFRDEFSRLKVPTAHTTDFGFCIHDYTMTPCQMHLDCIHCEDLVCVKGDTEKTERLKKRLKMARCLMVQAENAVNEGYAGSDRWMEHHRSEMERLNQLCEILDDPDVPIGAVIQLSQSQREKLLTDQIKRVETKGRTSIPDKVADIAKT